MQKLSNQEKWQPWKGVVLQAVSVLLLFFVGGIVQSLWGMIGLAITEIMFLALAIGYTKFQKTPLKEVFPIKKPTVRDIFGTLVLWIAALLFGVTTIGFMMWILPDLGTDTVEGLSGTLMSTPPVVTFLIAGLMACICEEAIERGAVMSHFRTIKKDWVIVLIIGLFFGIIHLDVIRFFNTAILGAALAYLMVKKNNFLLPMLLHLVNNTLSVVATFMTSDIDQEAVNEAANTLASSGQTNLGAYLIVACGAPLLLVLAMWLLTGKDKKDMTDEEREKYSYNKSKRIVFAAGAGFLMLVAGFGLIMSSPEYKQEYQRLTEEYDQIMEEVNASQTDTTDTPQA